VIAASGAGITRYPPGASTSPGAQVFVQLLQIAGARSAPALDTHDRHELLSNANLVTLANERRRSSSVRTCRFITGSFHDPATATHPFQRSSGKTWARRCASARRIGENGNTVRMTIYQESRRSRLAPRPVGKATDNAGPTPTSASSRIDDRLRRRPDHRLAG